MGNFFITHLRCLKIFLWRSCLTKKKIYLNYNTEGERVAEILLKLNTILHRYYSFSLKNNENNNRSSQDVQCFIFLDPNEELLGKLQYTCNELDVERDILVCVLN